MPSRTPLMPGFTGAKQGANQQKIWPNALHYVLLPPFLLFCDLLTFFSFLKSIAKSTGLFVQKCTFNEWVPSLVAKFKASRTMALDTLLDIFSCFVGYWLHDLIKTVAKWTLQFVFLQPQVYWLLFFPWLSIRFITYSYCRINLNWPKSVMEFIAQ